MVIDRTAKQTVLVIRDIMLDYTKETHVHFYRLKEASILKRKTLKCLSCAVLMLSFFGNKNYRGMLSFTLFFWGEKNNANKS